MTTLSKQLFSTKFFTLVFLTLACFVAPFIPLPPLTETLILTHDHLGFVLFLLALLFISKCLANHVIEAWRVKNGSWGVFIFIALVVCFIEQLLIFFGSITVTQNVSYQVGTSIALIYYIASFLESSLKNKSDVFLLNLKKQRANETCTKLVGQDQETVFVKDLKKGDHVLIKLNSVIPCDGFIINGMTSIDESPLTGHKHPLFKQKNDEVFAGSLNLDSPIVVEVTKDQNETLLEKLITHFTNFFTTPQLTSIISYPVVLLSLAILAAVVLFFFGPSLQTYSYSFAPLFIIFNPGAFHLIERLNLAKCLDQLIKKGVFIKEKRSLAQISRLQTLFFDKTGTFTEGNFQFSQFFMEYGTNQGELLATFFSIAEQSQHPLCRGVVTHPWYNEIGKFNVIKTDIQPGLGISAVLKNKQQKEYTAALGNLRFLKRHRFQLSRDMKAKIEELESIGETILLCGYDNQIRGVMSFSDTIRHKVRETLQDLQQENVELGILTGDTEENIAHFIKSLNIKKVYAHCTPQEKQEKIKREQGLHKIVGYVSNGSLALEPLKQADVSIQVNIGTNIQDAPGSILLLNSNIRLLGKLFKIVRSSFRQIKQFYQLSLIGHLLFLILMVALSATTAFIGLGIFAWVGFFTLTLKPYLQNND